MTTMINSPRESLRRVRQYVALVDPDWESPLGFKQTITIAQVSYSTKVSPSTVQWALQKLVRQGEISEDHILEGELTEKQLDLWPGPQVGCLAILY